MTAPRRLQLRRGNTAATSTYVGAAGELVVNTTTNTLYLHDGSTVGGYATTTNTSAINNQISSVNANITLANTGMQGYVNLANTIQSAQISAANIGIRGYVDATIAANIANIAVASTYSNVNVRTYLGAFDGNIIPSANTVYSLGSVTRQWKDLFVSNNTIYVGGVPLSIDTTGNLTINGNVIPTISYINTAVANVTVDLSSYALNANVTAANVGLKGYVDLANTIQSAQLTSANLGVIGYIDQANTIQSAQISAANVGMRGYVDQANTIQSAQVGAANLAITAANVGLKGYVDSQSFYSNVKVATYLPTYSGNIAANISKAGYTWTFGTDAVLTLPSGATILESGYGSAGAIRLKPNGGTSTQYLEIAPTAADGNHVHLMAGSGTELFLGDDNQYVKLANTGGVVINSNDGAGNTAQWTFGQDGTTLFPNQAIDGGTAPIELKSRSWSQLTYNNVDMNQQPNKNHSTTFYVEGGDALLEIFRWDSGNVMQHRQWTFFHDGNLTLPSGGYILNSDNSIYGGGSSYSNVQVATYLPTYTGNVANIRLGTSGVLTFADGTTQITAGGGSYSNVQVATYLPTYAGTVSASLVNSSGNILSSGLSVFGNTRIGLAGAVSGQFHTVVGNITQTSSGGAVYINTTGNVLAAAVVAGAVTSTGTVAVNAATGITTNQGTFLLANATATTINMGGAATTIRMGTINSNVFVGDAIGNSNKELTLRAQGTWNIATNINSNGGFNSPPYANQLVIGGSGTGMTANYSATGGYLTTVTIYNRGTGYQNGDVLSVPGGIAGNSFTLTNYSSTLTGNSAAAYTFGIEGNLIVPGNVTAARFIGDGTLLTTLPGYAYSNVNVAAYLATATITTTGNITAANFVGNISITGNVTGTSANVTLQAGSYSSTFDNQGNVTVPKLFTAGNIQTAGYLFGNGTLLTGVAIKTTGSWTVPTGNSTQSFTVASGTYQLWVDCNIPNGILAWNATATVTNSNVPVVGVQYAWVYNGGGTPIDFTSIPNQFVGTGNTIVRSSVSPSVTTNRFDFGINNTSGGNVTVSYGYVKIS